MLQTCRRCISNQLKDHAILALQGHLGIDFEHVTSVGKVVMHISPAAVLLCYSSSLTLTVEGDDLPSPGHLPIIIIIRGLETK